MPAVYANSISIAHEFHYPSTSNDQKPPQYVVLINGLADPKETWAAQIPALVSAGYTVLTFDNRGIGETSSPAGPYSASLLAADTKALVSHLRVSKFHLMGVSMGGMIAQQYALDYPQDLLSLTLACTYAAPGPFCSRMFKMWENVAPIMGVPFVMRDVLLWAFTTDFFSNPARAEELREVEQSMKFMTQSTPAYLAQLAVIQDFDVTKELRRLDVITHVIAGENDILIPVQLSKDLRELIPSSTFACVKGGHGCMWEYPESFNREFLRFLEQVEENLAPGWVS